jgi:hypothetical protein
MSNTAKVVTWVLVGAGIDTALLRHTENATSGYPLGR